MNDPQTEDYFATLSEEGAEADFEAEVESEQQDVPLSPVHTIRSAHSTGRDKDTESISSQLRKPSMATVRLKRRARLAEKLREVFELKDIEEVVAGMRFLIFF